MPLNTLFPGTAALAVAGVAQLPTPVEPLELSIDGLASGSLSVKRDDLTSPAYGGNKVRKLDFLLGEAVEQGRGTVLTFGAYGSNHALATAVHARALGLEPHVVLSPQEPGPYAPRTLLAHAGLGTHIHLVDGWDGRRAAVVAKREIEQRDGVGPFIIAMGGTSALGAVGYVNAALEVDVADRPDVVYVAAGTLGTAVGLAIGFRAASVVLGAAPVRVESVRVTPGELCNPDVAKKLTAETVALLRSHDDAFPDIGYEDLDFVMRDEFFDPGYGVVTPETERAVELAASVGLKLETTYTGKAFSAMLADAALGRLEGKRVLFWDTYNSAPYPPAGAITDLPATLQEYIAECEERFGKR
jgi:1-aminocyclopropane-1-carboxylate deaminase/D-cysteine desulfhydrase-like pyridoxal-dependent ACC family enzyme